MNLKMNLDIKKPEDFEWLPNTIYFNDHKYERKEKHGPGQSLNPTPSMRYYAGLIHRWKIFNRHQRQDGHPELSFELWCWNNNVDLSGRTKVDLSKLPNVSK